MHLPHARRYRQDNVLGRSISQAAWRRLWQPVSNRAVIKTAPTQIPAPGLHLLRTGRIPQISRENPPEKWLSCAHSLLIVHSRNALARAFFRFAGDILAKDRSRLCPPGAPASLIA
jgi:hypothetical protein